MRKPLVTIATRIFVPEPAAASFRLKALANALVDNGCEVTVATTTVPGNTDDETHRFTVKRFPALRDSEGYIKGYIQYLSFDVPLFFRLLTGPRADVYVCEPPPTTGFMTRVISTLKRRPYVYYAADIWADAAGPGYPSLVVKALRTVENFALRGASDIIAVSDAVADRLAELGFTNVTVAPNGIDTDVFSPAGDTPNHGRYFVYAGTSSEWQGAEIFADALASIHDDYPDVSLVYLGQGNSKDTIDTIADTLPAGTITQLGRMSPTEAASWQRGAVAALVSIRPGLGYDFAMPTKVYSALATGTPVIYAGPGPLREPITDDNLGHVVDYDVTDVAQAMRDALAATSTSNDRERRRTWVIDYHSLQETGRRAARGVLSAMNRVKTKLTS